jgi:glycosyltransferase involved in cell wall biosynthesis
MKIGIHSPYLNSIGGGERYMLTIASVLSARHDVRIFWDNASDIVRSSRILDIPLDTVRVEKNIFRMDRIRRMIYSSGYDLVIFLSDGSIPVLRSRHALVHFQVPLKKIDRQPWKWMGIDAVVCNSRFTMNNLDPEIPQTVHVIYPPIDTKKYLNDTGKEHIILSVGRFHPLKKQDILIEAFRRLKGQAGFKGWKLILAGSLMPSDRGYLDRLHKMASDGSVEILVDRNFTDMQAVYARSSIYWHAAGYDEQEPANFEHFGISTVEAMASGAVPVVFDGGGLPEIVEPDRNGYLWKDISQLEDLTVRLVKSPQMVRKLRDASVIRSRDFDITVFSNQITRIVEKVAS